MQKKKDYGMYYNQSILNYDLHVNKVQVTESQNLPAAGKGVLSIIIRAQLQVISPGNSLPYWGCAYIHKFQECEIDDVHVELEHRHCVWYADSSSPPELSTGTLVEEFRLARHGGGRLIIYLLFLANHLFFVRYLY